MNLAGIFLGSFLAAIIFLVIMCGMSLMMVSFGFMVAMLVAVLGVETVTFAGGTIALFLWLAWFFNFLKGL